MKYNWDIAKKSSSIDFKIKYYQIGSINGKFIRFHGNIVAGENLEDLTVALTLDVASIRTMDESWDQKLVSEDFLASKIYPVIIFHSEGGCQLRSGRVQELEGHLFIKGIGGRLVMVVNSAILKTSLKLPTATFLLTGSFCLTDFGFPLTNNIIGNEVRLIAKIKLIRADVYKS